MEKSPHLILAGGGLANCLIAMHVAQSHPDTRITIIEAGKHPGGNHTWSFHEHDLTPQQHRFVQPMLAHRWDHQEVWFPKYRRRLETAYLSLTSESMLDWLARHSAIDVVTETAVADVEPDRVINADGGAITGSCVIDGRGPRQQNGMVLGFQKFVGREIVTREPHGLSGPVIMDATVSQQDGYRFVYLLPFSSDRLLIEDTCYSDGAALSEQAFNDRIDAYIRQHGWHVDSLLREERGVLPILLAGDFDTFWPPDECVARAGLNAGLFHPLTGYSLPMAVDLADAITDVWPLDGPTMAAMTREHTRVFWSQTGFFRLLNRMLFRAGAPDQRYRVLERFYRLSTPLITNFYAAQLTLGQKCRILTGKPPVPVFAALNLTNERTFLRREQDSA